MTLPLEYQSTLQPLSPARRQAAQVAAWTGIPDILIGATCLGACIWTLPSPLDPNMILLWQIIGLYGFFFLASGILYTLGSLRIKSGSAPWHRALILLAATQIAAVLIWYAFLTLNTMHVQWAIAGSLLFGCLIILSRLRLIHHVRKSWHEIKPPR